MVARTRGRSTTSAALIDRWVPWVVGALVVLVYAPVLRSGFRFDDHHLIVENALLRDPRLLWQCFTRPLTSTEVTSGMYRPLTIASYMADYAVGGLAPAGYHLVNLLLHAVNAWLGYRLVRLMRPQVSAPAVAAVTVLWLLHPAHLNAVAYIASRSTLLATCSVLTALWAYRRSVLATSRSAAWYALALLACVGALGAKEIGIVTPALIVLADLTVWAAPGERDALRRWPWRRWRPFLLLGLAYLGWHYRLTGALGPAVAVRPGWFNLGASCLAVWHYLWFLVAPAGLCLTRVVHVPTQAADPLALAAMAGYVALWLLVVWWLRRRPVAACALGWFLLALFPTHPMASLFLTAADHHLYLPSLGFVVAAAVVVDALWRHGGRCVTWALAALLIICGTSTWQRSRCWADEVCAWESTVRQAPQSVIAWTNLGQAYETRGRLDDAQRALLSALRLGGIERGAVIGNLGRIVAARGQQETALPLLRLAVAYSPRTPLLLHALALALSQTGRYDEAATCYRRTIEANPAIAEAYNNWGADLARQGRLTEAIAVFRRGLPWDHEQTSLRRNLAQALAAVGPPPPARETPP